MAKSDARGVKGLGRDRARRLVCSGQSLDCLSSFARLLVGRTLYDGVLDCVCLDAGAVPLTALIVGAAHAAKVPRERYGCRGGRDGM